MCNWEPLPGPQTMAYNSEADITGYGGAAGGGKTDLLLGLARTQHSKAVIFRDTYPNLKGMIDRSRVVYSPGEDSPPDPRYGVYNEQGHRWKFPENRWLEFESCDHEKDKEKQRGRDRDFQGLDEVTQFSKSQVMFIMAWNRSTKEGQRCRVVMTFNPPSEGRGMWVIDYFLPWLAFLHPEVFHHENPAAPGELRWYTRIGDREVETPDGREFVVEEDGTWNYDFDREEYKDQQKQSEILRPLSRTFIPASLEDNPYLSNSNYRSMLQSLDEPLRSQLLNGDFSACMDDDAWQVIPTEAWDRAVKRWNDANGSTEAPLTRAGVDVARGGLDNSAMAPIHNDGFCGEIVTVPGKETRTGRDIANKLVLPYLDKKVALAVDVIGVGSSPVDVLEEEGYQVVPINGSGKAVVMEYGKEVPYEDPTSHVRCVNLRSAGIWNLRKLLEADAIAVPPNPRLRRAALAHRWSMTSAGIRVNEKDEVKLAIGYSPDEFDTVWMGYWLTPPAPAVKTPGIWDTPESKLGIRSSR